MEWFSPDHVTGKTLDHIGLVAATIDKIGLTEKIDRRIPVSHEKGAKITMGQRVTAMIMNGLGFVDDRLYLFPEFLKNKPVDADMLSEYKGQSKTESGFRFIKDNTFEVSSVFLKKPERISALMMIMTLCLMVYGIAQHHLRESLDRAGDMVPDQTKKPTSRPTMKWIYRMFCNIQVIALEMEGHIREIVINVTEIHRKIIRYFGEVAMRIYEVSPA